MRRLAPAGVLVLSLLLPTIASAQASITGAVRDASGAVLPGVTVEAASPALIEKVRTVVTDGTGQYRIENLRPGTYAVTFTLAGFSTVQRTDIELAGSFTATVNADLRLGSIEETITVTGESPIVDVQNVTQQRVVDHEVTAALPTGRSDRALGALVPGVVGGQDAACPARRAACRSTAAAPAPSCRAASPLLRGSGPTAATTRCPTWRRSRKCRATPARARRRWRSAASASTSRRRTAAIRSTARCSPTSRTIRCRATTTRPN